MNALRHIQGSALAAMLLFPGIGIQAQCTNTILFPGVTIPDALGALTTISTCSYQVEYSDATNIIAGAAYQFTCTNNAYITVHQDTYNGTVVGQGYSPLTVTAVTSGDLFPSWTVDDLCATASGVCQTTTVQLFLNCTPPTASIQSIDDCPNNAFSVQVNVTSVGDGASVNVNYDVNGVPSGGLPGVGVGSYLLGPFTVGSIIDITVEHELDATCNIHFNNVQSQNTCPTIVTCGGANAYGIYCYTNSDSQHWLYQSSGTQEIALQFTQGTIESATWDHLRIYNGIDNSTTPIYDHVGGHGRPHRAYVGKQWWPTCAVYGDDIGPFRFMLQWERDRMELDGRLPRLHTIHGHLQCGAGLREQHVQHQCACDAAGF